MRLEMCGKQKCIKILIFFGLFSALIFHILEFDVYSDGSWILIPPYSFNKKDSS